MNVMSRMFQQPFFYAASDVGGGQTSSQQVFQIIKSAIFEITGKDTSGATLSTPLSEFTTSGDLPDVLTAAAAAVGCVLTEEDAKNIKTIGALVSRCEELLRR